jgi:GDP-L-fucose synthase
VSTFWSGQNVIVTGGAGFLGSYVLEKLQLRGCGPVTVPRSEDCDLTDAGNISSLFDRVQPTMVIHLAARVGGIGANRANPGRFFYENLMMGTNLLEQARLHNIPKFVAIGTICSYPKFTPVPFREENLWDGYPEETNAPYGLAKKMLLVQSQAYRQQYNFNSIFLLPVNLYGPRDNFNPESSHVIPALIRKAFEALQKKEPSIVCWGDGTPTREFLYVEDCAEAILLAAERYNGDQPVNLGSGMEISIKELASKICQLAGFSGSIEWDTSKPNGQPRRRLDVSRAKLLFGFEAKVTFDEGLKKTVQWYQQNYL